MIVSTARDISREIDHRVVNALIPFQRSLIEHISERCPAVRNAACDPVASRPGQSGVNADVYMSGNTEHADASLSAENRGREGVGQALYDSVSIPAACTFIHA